MNRCTKKNCPMVGVSADCDLKDCPYRTETGKSKDTIYRDDAIKAVKRISDNYTGKGKRDYHPHVDFIIDELKYCVPSADRPQGEWETAGEKVRYKRCPFCKRAKPFEDSRFCDWCGARMKGAGDEKR